MRVETHTVPAPPEFYLGGRPGPLVADLDLGTYFRGTPSGELLIGGTEPACDPLEWVDDPDRYDPKATRALYEAQVYRAARRLPDLTVPVRPSGIGAVYDVADDWIPIYDKTALAGFYVAIGTSGNQFKNAPLVGAYLTAIIEACESGIDHDETPASFHLPRSGLDLDLSAYSRRRQPSPDSSNTVMG
jgi:sarcosine oxidase subunit beta